MPVSLATVHASDTVRLIDARFRDPATKHIAEGLVGDNPVAIMDLIELADATNPRVLWENGTIPGAGVPAFGRQHGRIIRAAFAHPSGSGRGGARFNRDQPARGAWYASDTAHTAVLEVQHHRGEFYAESGIRDETAVMDAYLADMAGPMVVVEKPEPGLLDPGDYAMSQDFADRVRDDGHLAIYYPSVRCEGGVNIACLGESIVQNVRRGEAVDLRWAGGVWTSP